MEIEKTLVNNGFKKLKILNLNLKLFYTLEFK